MRYQAQLKIIAREAGVEGYHTENRDQMNVFILNGETCQPLLLYFTPRIQSARHILQTG